MLKIPLKLNESNSIVYIVISDLGPKFLKSNKIMEKKKYHCHICKKVIVGSTYKLKTHLYLHNAVKPRFECKYCLKKYFRNDIYKRHIESHLKDSTDKEKNKKLHICDYCDRGFINKRNLIMHLKIHDDSIYDLQNEFKCTACSLSYCERRLLQYHIRKVHFNLGNEQCNMIEKKLNETWVEPVNKIKACVEITKVNNNVITIKKCPVKREDIEKCQQEKKPNEYMTSMFASESHSNYSKAICDYCNKEMLKKSLPKHIRECHLMVRKFKCHECNIAFSRPYQLVNHHCGKTRVYKNKHK